MVCGIIAAAAILFPGRSNSAEQRYGEDMKSCWQYKQALQRTVEFDDIIGRLGNYRSPIMNSVTSAFRGHGPIAVTFDIRRRAMLAELVRCWSKNAADMQSQIHHWETESFDINESPAGLHAAAEVVAGAFKIRMRVAEDYCREIAVQIDPSTRCEPRCSTDPEIVALLKRMHTAE